MWAGANYPFFVSYKTCSYKKILFHEKLFVKILEQNYDQTKVKKQRENFQETRNYWKTSIFL